MYFWHHTFFHGNCLLWCGFYCQPSHDCSKNCWFITLWLITLVSVVVCSTYITFSLYSHVACVTAVFDSALPNAIQHKVRDPSTQIYDVILGLWQGLGESIYQEPVKTFFFFLFTVLTGNTWRIRQLYQYLSLNNIEVHKCLKIQ